MLICSMRISPPTDDGSAASWHIEKVAGGDIVYTCPPKYIGELMEVADQMKPFDPETIHEPPPAKTLDKLLRIPYFVQAYEPEGMVPDEFNRQAALIATMAEFSTATRGMVDFVAQQFQAEGKM
jgi:transaldolase